MCQVMHAWRHASCKGIRVPWWAVLHIGLNTVVRVLKLLMLIPFEMVIKSCWKLTSPLETVRIKCKGWCV